MNFSRFSLVALVSRTLVATVLVMLVACSSDDVKPAELVKFKPTVQLAHKWSNGIGNQGKPELYIRLTPAIAGDVIYAATAKGHVVALSRESGKTLWSTSTHESLVSAVGSGEGLVLVGTVNGMLLALHSENGKEAWHYRLSSEMLAAAQAADHVVVAQTIDGHVVALDSSNGTLRWQYQASVSALSLRTSAAPVLENGVAYLAFSSGKIMAIDSSNGLQLWEQQVTLPEGRNELERMVDFDGRPLVIGSDLYFAGYQGHAVMMDKGKGDVTWSEKISTMGQIAYGNGNLYITQSDDTVVALKMANGRRLWENNLLSHRQVSAPAVIGNYVAVADFDGYIHLLNQDDGQLAGRYSLWFSDGVRNPLQSDGDTLYVLANSGRLTALSLEKLPEK